MSSASNVRIFKFLNSSTPVFLRRFLKSVLFYKKHFSESCRQRQVTLPKEIINLKSAVCLIGHSNFTSSMGGTERVLIEKTEKMLSENIDSVFIYPKGSPERLTLLKPCSYGVALNGYEITEIHGRQLKSFFEALQPKLQKIEVHHLLFWPLREIKNILNRSKKSGVKVDLHLHDFHFKCPKVNWICKNDKSQCRRSYLKSTHTKWESEYNEILEISEQIVTPSEFMQNFVPEKFKSKTKIQTPEPLKSPLPIAKKMTLAYLGADSILKGFETWKRIANNALITRLYDLLQVGTGKIGGPLVQQIPYSYQSSKDCPACEILQKLRIDMVLLWSQVPESYSFTFHEAVKAGKFVITSTKSGNIAYSLPKMGHSGAVLNSDYELFQFLLKRGTQLK